MDQKHPAWKRLLQQALNTTSIETNSHGRCRFLDTRRYIQAALQNAGIENRSPFNLWQILKIHWHSHGSPAKTRQLCISTLMQMQQPARPFSQPMPQMTRLLTVCSLIYLLLPQTATTYLAAAPAHTIIKITTLPWGDQDAERIEPALQSDYLLAAFEPQVLYPDDALASLSGAGWIARQADSAYTLQLLSVSDKGNLKQFCKQYKICDQSSIYTSQIDGRPITRLLYGVYRNHRAAKQAKAALPKDLSGWARQFGQIKSEL